MSALRIVLGDQLTRGLSSLRDYVPGDTVLMMEVAEEATYVKHHKQKLVLIFSAMRHFAEELRHHGFTVDYVRLDDPAHAAGLRSLRKALGQAVPALFVETSLSPADFPFDGSGSRLVVVKAFAGTDGAELNAWGEAIVKHDAILAVARAACIQFIDAATIDRMNILQATLHGMRRAVLGLQLAPELVLIDGNRLPADLPCPARALVGGDGLVRSIMAASILAKVSRDRHLQIGRAHV